MNVKNKIKIYTYLFCKNMHKIGNDLHFTVSGIVDSVLLTCAHSGFAAFLILIDIFRLKYPKGK